MAACLRTTRPCALWCPPISSSPKRRASRWCRSGPASLQRPIPYDEAKNWGLVHWARPILNVLFDGNADTTSYEVDQILGPSHYRFDISLGESPKQDANAV